MLPVTEPATSTQVAPEASKDALIRQLGTLVLQNERYAASDWEGIAIVADFVDGDRSTYGYIFRPDGSWEARLPSGFMVLREFGKLQDAMHRETGKKWHRALLHIVRSTETMNIQFEYDDRKRWGVSPGKLEESVAALRP